MINSSKSTRGRYPLASTCWAPLLVGLVFSSEKRGTEPNGLSRDRATKTSRRAGNSSRMACRNYERALIDFHLPQDGVDAIMRVDVPAIAESSGNVDGRVALGRSRCGVCGFCTGLVGTERPSG